MSQEADTNKKIKMDQENDDNNENELQVLVFCITTDFFGDGYTKPQSEVTADEQMILDIMATSEKYAFVFADLFYALFISNSNDPISFSLTRHDIVTKMVPHFTVEHLEKMQDNHTWKRKRPIDYNAKKFKIYMQTMYDD